MRMGAFNVRVNLPAFGPTAGAMGWTVWIGMPALTLR